MILLDFNQIFLASAFQMEEDKNEDFLRHMFLNSLRANRKQFYREYGELVICCDSPFSWRRDVFEYYKAKRRESQASNAETWTNIFDSMRTIKEELINFLPYPVISVKNAEADDIIGAMVEKYGTYDLSSPHEKILILSGDKDFQQLQKYKNVTQYSPVMNKYIQTDDPESFLFEHILKGDSSDGIPNILSPGNSIVIGQRQRPMTAKRIEAFRNIESMSVEERARYEVNKQIIDLSFVPERIKAETIRMYEESKPASRSGLVKYFMDKKLRNLIQDINDF